MANTLPRYITHITVDGSARQFDYIVSAKQGDMATRFVSVLILCEGGEYQIPEDAALRCNFRKPDGKTCYNVATRDGNRVLVELTNQMLAVPGKARADVEIATKDSKQILYSATFGVEIARTLRDDEAILSSNEMSALDAKWAEFDKGMADYAEAERQRAQAEQARATAESARDTAEQARVKAEQARATAESARDTEEKTRASAESTRQQQETARQTAEAARVKAEQGRDTAEKARASAETERGKAESTRQQQETARQQNTGKALEAVQDATEQALLAAEQAKEQADRISGYADAVLWFGYDDNGYFSFFEKEITGG